MITDSWAAITDFQRRRPRGRNQYPVIAGANPVIADGSSVIAAVVGAGHPGGVRGAPSEGAGCRW